MNTTLLIWNALISGAVGTMPSHPEDLREPCNETSAAKTSRELQPDRSSSTPSKRLSEVDPEDMNKKFREVLAKELSLTPEGIAKMFGDYHLNCTRRRANERELTLRSKNHFSELERARAAVAGLAKAEWQELTLEAASLAELHQGRRSEKN